MRDLAKLAVLAASLAAIASTPSRAAVITTYYGDDDGFGVGLYDFIDPVSNDADPGEAPGTDVRLIGGTSLAPGFKPLGGFDPFSISGTVTSAVLTLRLGAFNSGPDPLEPPNLIVLDGLTVPASFIDGFSQTNLNGVETRSFALDSSFFSIFSDGAVSLDGTRLTEAYLKGSFKVDFLRLDITTAADTAVPEPGTWAMMLAGFGVVGASLRRRRRKAQALRA